MLTTNDDTFLRRAMRLAMSGRGRVEPNPMVGCVLVKDGQIIGEGWHAKFGDAHAEPNALADCTARGNDPAGATAYVTLEPCCHTDKKTPPCAPRLIEARIARVVIGCLDPNESVNGHGVAMLRSAGIAVDVLPGARDVSLAPVVGGEGWGEGEDAGGSEATREHRAATPSPRPSPPATGERELVGSHFQQLIAPFAQRHFSDHELYLTLKWAETADGRVAGRNGERLQITNDASSRLVHQLRARSAAIMVGVNTVISDDPLLNVRGVTIDRQPARVVLDRDLRIPATSKLVTSAPDGSMGQVIVLCSPTALRDSPRVAELERHIEIDALDTGDLRDALEVTAAFGGFTAHRDFLVEPGPTLARALLPSADRLWVFRSPKKTGGGPSAPRAAPIPDHYVATGTLNLAGDTLTEYFNTRSPAFFAAVPSADFVLAEEAAGSSVA